ncbi:MAG: EAL domain-containing protein [Deltaproteobacteria bacterium]|nr:EAL domain-containing protein [Deltaproteobacteria bacterium]
MNPFVLLNLGAAAVHFAHAVAVFRRDPRAPANRMLALTGLLFTWWGLSYAFAQGATDSATYWWWYRASAVSWTLAPPVMLHLLLHIARGVEVSGVGRRWYRALIYLPGLVFLVRTLTGSMFVGRIERGPWGWVEYPAEGTAWPLIFSAYFLGCLVAGILAFVVQVRREPHLLRRRQAKVVVLAGSVTVAGITLVEVVLPAVYQPLPIFSAFLAVGWTGGVWYAMQRAGLLEATVAAAAEEILAALEDAVVRLDEAGRILQVNGAAVRMFGRDPAELVGRSWTVLLAEQRVVDEARLERFLAAGPVEHFETIGRRASGETMPLFVSAAGAGGRDGGRAGTVLVVRDASNLRRTEERIHQLAHHDGLTGLPNRLLFRDRLETALHRARRCDEPLGVMLVDLDGFKAVNDRRGHEAGDAVLRAVAERLAAGVRKSDTVARLGGDEFGVVLPDLRQADDVLVVADRLLGALRETVDAGGRVVAVQASIGVGMRPQHGDDADALLRAADAAMYRVKATGQGGCRVWDPAWSVETRGRVRAEERLREAVARNELVLHYQPQRSIRDGSLVGVEALVRWRHPERGLLLPMDFLPAAAAAGLLRPIGRWVLEAAVAQACAWEAAGHFSGRMAVNLWSGELRNPELADEVGGLLGRTGLPAGRLELELTEDAEAVGDETAVRTLERLGALGVGVTLDDFGSGPTSLVFLARFPVRTLKLGLSLVGALPGDADVAAIVRAATSFSRSTGVERVVAEGVEREEQLVFLRAAGVDDVQGHLIGRPVPGEELDLTPVRELF